MRELNEMELGAVCGGRTRQSNSNRITIFNKSVVVKSSHVDVDQRIDADISIAQSNET